MEEPVTLTSSGLGLVLFGIALLAAVRLLQRDPESSEDGVLEVGMGTGGWVLIHLGLFAFFFGALLGFGLILCAAMMIVLAR